MHQSKTIILSTLTMSLLVLAGCSAQPTTNTTINTPAVNGTAKTNAINTAAPVNTVETTTNTVNQNVNTMSNISDDTQNWLTFQDDDLGITFSYPNDYEIVIEEIVDFSDTSKYNPNDYGGKSKSLIIESKKDDTKKIILSANTKNIKNIYTQPFSGEDLSAYCADPGNIQSDTSYCEVVEKNNKSILYTNKFVNMECSPHFNTTLSIVNPNENSDFSGLQLAASLPGIQKDILDKPFKDNDPCSGNIDIDSKLQNYLRTDFAGANLSNVDNNLFSIMKQIIYSIQSY